MKLYCLKGTSKLEKELAVKYVKEERIDLILELDNVLMEGFYSSWEERCPTLVENDKNWEMFYKED